MYPKALRRESISTRNHPGISRQSNRFAARLAVLFVVAFLGAAQASPGQQRAQEESFYPAWASQARYLQPLMVLDTDSALGRRNLYPKRITLKDMARMHGHLCDGLVTAWVELGAALRVLFPDGVVDRTDVRAVSKNAPCWADAGAWMTGARISSCWTALWAMDSFCNASLPAPRFEFPYRRGSTLRTLLHWSNRFVPGARMERLWHPRRSTA